jgi:S-DNA-T family DNA segregation ATPase FtsK/SpoIIIE
MIRPHRRRTRRRNSCEPLSIYQPIHFGIDENGLRVEVTLMYRNLLIGGEPGSGKSSLLNTIIAHAALASDVKLFGR